MDKGNCEAPLDRPGKSRTCKRGPPARGLKRPHRGDTARTLQGFAHRRLPGRPTRHAGYLAVVTGHRATAASRRDAEKIQDALYRIAELASVAQDLQEFYRAVLAVVGVLM
jgi:hypothetical protein